MATPLVADQLTLLSTRLGEPTDPAQARWTPAQLLAELNSQRAVVAEATRCYQVLDEMDFTTGGSVVAPLSQPLPAVGQPFTVSLTDDFIWLEEMSWCGRPLRVVRPHDWRDVVGSDDTISGDPSVFLFHGRQLSIFAVPTQAGALKYRGWAYPPALVLGGNDVSFTIKAGDTAVWAAAFSLKGSDERSNSHEEKMMDMGLKELKSQYMPRGPRYVATGELYLPWRPLP
jgi:hypothetical protein